MQQRSQAQIEELLNRYPLDEYPLQSHGYIPTTSDYRIRLTDQQGVVTFTFKDVIEVNQKLTAAINTPKSTETEASHQEEAELLESEDIDEKDSGEEPSSEDMHASEETSNEADPSEEISEDELDALFDDGGIPDAEELMDTTEDEPVEEVNTEEDTSVHNQSDSVDTIEESKPEIPRMIKAQRIELPSPFWYYVEFSNRAREWTLRLPMKMHEIILVTPFKELRLVFRDVSVKHEPAKRYRMEDSMLRIAG